MFGLLLCCFLFFCFFFKQKTAYEMRISDWSSDVCSSDLGSRTLGIARPEGMGPAMTLFEPVGKKPEPSAPAGFVPSRSEDDVARHLLRQIGRASCRERVCQYV